MSTERLCGDVMREEAAFETRDFYLACSFAALATNSSTYGPKAAARSSCSRIE